MLCRGQSYGRSAATAFGAALCFIALSLSSVAIAQTAAGPLLTVGAKPSSGEIIAADLSGDAAKAKFTFRTAGKDSTIAAAKLVRFGAWRELPRSPLVLLPGADAIVITDPAAAVDYPIRLVKDLLHVESDLFGKIELPLTAIEALVLSVPAAIEDRDRLLAKLAGHSGKTDKLLLANGDELAGSVIELDMERIKVRAAAGDLTLDVAQVVAIALNPSLVARPRIEGLHALAGFEDGSRLTAKTLRLAGETAELKLAAGPTLKATAASLVAVQTIGGEAKYLSQLKPSSYRHVPFLDIPWPYHEDRSVVGTRLRAGKQVYLRGLGMHSLSLLTYDLDGAYRQFQTELAIDDAAAGGGSVVFRVFADEGDGWKARYTSPAVRGGDAPLPIAVDIAGAKRISLRVDFGDRGDQLDYADWLEARLIP